MNGPEGPSYRLSTVREADMEYTEPQLQEFKEQFARKKRRQFSFRNWRCPACNGYLGRSMSMNFCPKCGVELR